MSADMEWRTTHGDRVQVWKSSQVHVSVSPQDTTDRQITNVVAWYWHVVARNGRVVEHGESHTRRRGAVRAALRHHPRVEVES